jgi:hypothetical protein
MMLYHYTSLDALIQIVPNRCLWATDIHYLNDSSELRHASARFLAQVRRLENDSPQDKELLGQLAEWLHLRLADGHLLFVVCFTEDGDLLSQWRGYTPHAKGVSIGFSHTHLLECAADQQFLFGRCIYAAEKQDEVAYLAIRAIVSAARSRGPAPQSEAHPTQSYYPAFYEAEPALLRIAALLKHDAFEAEREWRAVSPVVSDYVNTEMYYRSGKTALVPYQKFRLSTLEVGSIGIDRAILGPTPNVNLGIQALSQFLARYRVCAGTRTISLSRVPYRET